MSRPFSLLVKPASADCNLRCRYCFYLGHRDFYPEASVHRMSPEVLESTIRSYLATEQPQYSFGWQGGEPTLLGLEFFRRVTDLQVKHGRRGALVANGLQTNGLLVDDELAAHFARYRFLLGVSLDGPADVHDRYRPDASGQGTHARVLASLATLRRHRVEFNVLTAVNEANAARAEEIYGFLLENGILYHQYIPIVEFDAAGDPLPFTVGPEAWGEFLCRLFDRWYASDTRTVSVRLFDAILHKLVDDRRIVCTMEDSCCQYFVVEHNGDVFPCDFFVDRDKKLGNVQTHGWPDLLASPTYETFGAAKGLYGEACRSCPYLALCAGDCLKHRCRGASDPARPSWLCAGWKLFYGATLDRFRQLAREVGRERRAAALAPAATGRPVVQRARVGRNDPCPCGSGRKYKHCCGAA